MCELEHLVLSDWHCAVDKEGLVAITGEVISPHEGLQLYNCT